MRHTAAISRPMTAVMAIALGEIVGRGGKVVRHQGGYWTVPGASHTGVIGNPFDWWVSTPTIDGLVRRGELQYTNWREGRNGEFPIEAERATPTGPHGERG